MPAPSLNPGTPECVIDGPRSLCRSPQLFDKRAMVMQVFPYRLFGAARRLHRTGSSCACIIGVGEFLFTPAAGYSVTLDYMHIGSWFATSGVGPLRNYDIRVYDPSWKLLFGQTGTVTTSQQVTFNTTSTSGLYLQWGSDWDVGVDNITATVSPTASVPEPATRALIVPTAAGLFALARRRRRAA